MALTSRPEFFELSAGEAAELLDRNHVGRLAFTFHDRVDIEPISYVRDDRYVYARTSPGTKLTTVKHHPWVAFQVDEVEGRYDWKSVTVRGTLYFLAPAGSDRDREAYDRGLELLRSVESEVLTSGDAAPHRTQLFRVFADEITGRGARTAK
jgi:nitroimidazol reductase NimA-like FMN-containing flavoprotein (pyridoxamine 5'-phosphate oxidase superfamily)